VLSIYHAPRLEDLAAQLCASLQQQRRANPLKILQPIEVVIGHLGMARWLEQYFAQRLGVFANVKFVLLGEWLERAGALLATTGNAENASPFVCLGKQANGKFPLENRYTTEAMTWALNELLSTQRYAAPNAQNPREQFALAARLARLFGEYLIYRREWSNDLGAYDDATSNAMPYAPSSVARAPEGSAKAHTPYSRDWQAALFRALVHKLGPQHRARRMSEYLQHLAQPAPQNQLDAAEFRQSARLQHCFFGLNHLPSDVVTLLHGLAQRADIDVYFANPCVEYWGDLVRERFMRQRQLSAELFGAAAQSDEGDFAHFDVGHPLLSSLGAHGQAYFAELAYLSDNFVDVSCADSAHSAENAMHAPNSVRAPELSLALARRSNQHSLLAAFQYGIAHLQPDYAPKSLRDDNSIEVISCESALDELEQVKRRIVQALNSAPSLQLEDIAIIAPDIARYAPLLAGVFATRSSAVNRDTFGNAKSPGDAPELRFSVLDFDDARARAGTQSGTQSGTDIDVRVTLVRHILQAQSGEWPRAELLDVLHLDPVAAHFGLDAHDLARATLLAERARIVAGLSPELALRTELRQGAVHTWTAGLDRALFGYLHGDDESEAASPQATAPLRAGVDARGSAEFEGDGDGDGKGNGERESDRTTDALTSPPSDTLWPVPQCGPNDAAVLSALCAITRTLSAAAHAAQRPRSVADWTRWLEQPLLALTGSAEPITALSDVAASAALAGCTSEVAFEAFRAALLAQLAQSTRAIAPSPGAICVCSLVPMRALPFKFVAIVGLNDAEFPKTEAPDALNLMQLSGARRAGDRSRTAEDRYLFLEALMAAREHLVLSYQRRPSARANTRRECQPAAILQEIISHLERQFAGVSRQPVTHGTHEPQGVQGVTAQLAHDSPMPTPGSTAHAHQQDRAPVMASNLALGQLLSFWRRPLDVYTQQRCQIAIPRTTDVEFTEPLDFTHPAIERLETRLLQHALHLGRLPARPPHWLGASGLLASGALGARSFEAMLESIRPSWFAIKKAYPSLCFASGTQRIDFELALAPSDAQLHSHARVGGSVSGIDLASASLLVVSSKAHHGAQKLRAMIELMALRLSAPERPWRALLLGPAPCELRLSSDTQSTRSYLAMLASVRARWLIGDRLAHSHATAPDSKRAPWFWPKLSALCAGKTHAQAALIASSANTFELTNSAFPLWHREGFFAPDSTEFSEFLALANAVFAPLQTETSSLDIAQFGHLEDVVEDVFEEGADE
jgi:exodeoxyribonuclease V gamma subunit